MTGTTTATGAAKPSNGAGAGKAFIILPPKQQTKKAVVIPAANNASSNSKTEKPEVSKPVSSSAGVDKKKIEHKGGKGKDGKVKPAAAPTTSTVDKDSFPKEKKKTVVWWKSYDSKTAKDLMTNPEDAWFEQYPDFLKEEVTIKNKTNQPFDSSKINELEETVANIYHHQVSLYKAELAKLGVTSDQKWLNSVIDSGTWSDKIAAMALKVQESPFYNLEALDLLIGIAVKKDLRTGFMAVEAIKDLLMNNVLPDRPLQDFGKAPYFLHQEMNMKTAVLAWFEHQLRKRMVQVLEVVETGLKSNIFHFRRQGLELAMDMLTKKPEQEARLLMMIVNKLGDVEGRVSSKTSELLKHLLNAHPAMKGVVIREVRMFIYRPGVKLSAIFTAVNFLTQIRIGPGDGAVALQLAECFLSLFEKALQAKEKGSRLLTVLLNGINKSFPFLDDIGPLKKYLDSIFRLVHTASSFATSTQALVLIASIVFAATKNATEDETEESIAIRNRFYVTLYSKLLSDDTIAKAKNTAFLNLLYRSVKNDPSIPRAKAFIKRIAICASETTPAITAGLLFMISEILSARPDLKSMLTEAELNVAENHSKKFSHDDDDDDEGSEDRSIANESTMTIAEHHLIGCYDAAKRNPLYACVNNQSPSLFEIALLRHHFHPSTKAFATALLQAPEHEISFQGDPLVEFSTMAFLNRFAYKNPKQKIAENLKKTTDTEEPINLVFTQGEVDVNTIAPEKHFFYKFFGEREVLRSMGKSKDRKKKKDNEEFDSDDDEDEDMDKDMDMDGKEEDEEDLDEEAEIDRFADKLAADMMKHDAATRGEDFEDDLDFSDDDDDEDDDEFDSEPEDDDEDSDEDSGEGKNKKRKKQLESSAFDFEDFKSEQSKQKSKKQKIVQEEDDDEDAEEPEAYMDSDDEDGDDGEEGFEFGNFMDDDDDDEDMMEMDDEEEEEEEEEVIEEPKGKKGKKKTPKPTGDDDDFADADAYEAQMDEIVNAYKYEAPAAKIAKAMKKQEEEKKSNKGGVSFADDVKGGDKKSNKKQKLRK